MNYRSVKVVLHPQMSPKSIQLHDLPHILRIRRRELGLTQKELGHLLGIDQRTVSALEKNPSSVSVSRLFAVIDALQLSIMTCPAGQAVEASPSALTVDQFFKNSRII